MKKNNPNRLKLILYSLAIIALLLNIAAGALYCLRAGVEIGARIYEGKQIACVAYKGRFNCKIMEGLNLDDNKNKL